MKKILISAYACMPDRGSEESNGWHYSTLVSQHGYQVWCLTRNVGEAAITQKLQESPYPNLKFEFVTVPAWVDRAYNRNLIGLYFHYLYWQWAALTVALRLHRQHHFDLVHHVSYTSLQLGSFLYKLKRPFIYGPVGGGQEAPAAMRRYFKQYWSRERMRAWISWLLLRFNPGCVQAVRQASYVLAWNEDTYQQIRQLGRSNGVVKVCGGISQRFIASEPIYRSPQPVLQLVWVGRLMPRKGLELSLHGLSKVDPKVPVHLTVVGDGEMSPYLTEYLDTYQLHDRVTCVGKMPYEQVKAYYRQADAFLLTSLRDTGPAQLLEAMGYSLPVVTLRLHGQAELVDDSTGIRVPVTEPEATAEALARAIEWLYAHPEERATMGHNAYLFAQRQEWSAKVTQIINDYYEPLLGPAEHATSAPLGPAAVQEA